MRSIVLGRSAFLGLGFGDRSDSFDLNVALQDHFKWVKNQEQIEKEKTEPKQQLDLGFKEGETIKINMRITVRINHKKFYLKLKKCNFLYIEKRWIRRYWSCRQS